MTKQQLLEKLEGIAQCAVQKGHVVAVLGLGSAGIERDRMDEYSDLDIWIVVEDGYKQAFDGDLTWLSARYPIAYKFKHSASGYGILYEDGIFSEMDIFEQADLDAMPFEGAQIVWKAPGVPDSIAVSKHSGANQQHTEQRSTEMMLGEALGNLYVGLGRYYRGEKLSAMRFIQVWALDQILKLAHTLETEQVATRDPFSIDRRFEQRFPRIAADLPDMLQGYERTPESTRAMLAFLDAHFQVEDGIKQAILRRLSEHSD